MNVEDRVRDTRIMRGLSQVDVWRAMADMGHKWSQTTVSRIESGRRPLRYAEAVDLSAVLPGLLPSNDVDEEIIRDALAYRRILVAIGERESEAVSGD